MGIFEQVQSGSIFRRSVTTITNTPISGSTTDFGGTYILLSVKVNNPCRIRLYSDSASVAIDAPRTTASFDISASVGLTVDTLITQSSYTLYFDPPAVGTTFSGSTTWYNISGSGVSATFTYYPIESAIATRSSASIYVNSLPTGTSQLGNITAAKSFLILSASCNYSASRLRIYSKDIGSIAGTEIARSFSTIADNQSNLIADMLFDSASYEYKLTPTLQAYNLQAYDIPTNTFGYIFENLSAGTMSNITASMYIYPVED